MLTIPDKVNILAVPGRLEPRAATAARILIITDLWLNGAYGVRTGAMAAAIAGCSLPLIDAARVVLQSGDKTLLAQVLGGHVSLTAAAEAFRRRVRLIESFRAASPADRAALGIAIGADQLFTDVVAPAL
jgi:hypothetical protein